MDYELQKKHGLQMREPDVSQQTRTKGMVMKRNRGLVSAVSFAPVRVHRLAKPNGHTAHGDFYARTSGGLYLTRATKSFSFCTSLTAGSVSNLLSRLMPANCGWRKFLIPSASSGPMPPPSRKGVCPS